MHNEHGDFRDGGYHAFVDVACCQSRPQPPCWISHHLCPRVRGVWLCASVLYHRGAQRSSLGMAGVPLRRVQLGHCSQPPYLPCRRVSRSLQHLHSARVAQEGGERPGNIRATGCCLLHLSGVQLELVQRSPLLGSHHQIPRYHFQEDKAARRDAWTSSWWRRLSRHCLHHHLLRLLPRLLPRFWTGHHNIPHSAKRHLWSVPGHPG
mmetsp:Transcript_46898/g.110421  ORF Transcript_46898/g.110421 Transcript_46898/m.110421 type:complete len:207 (+) Transcript_46898:271-891(+)